MGSHLFNEKNFNQSQESLPEHNECMRILNLVLDGEATEEQREYFQKVIKNCMPYFEIYHLDKTIKELIKSKCCSHEVPTDLIQSIKAKISQTAG